MTINPKYVLLALVLTASPLVNAAPRPTEALPAQDILRLNELEHAFENAAQEADRNDDGATPILNQTVASDRADYASE